LRWRNTRWALLGITLLATGLRLAGLGSKGFWFDECFTYTVTLAPLEDSLSTLLVAGIYSPLYFLLLRPVVALTGSSEYAFRFPSVVFGVLAVPLIYRLGSRLAGKATGVVAALLLTICPFHIWYSQDARMYAPMAFFSLAAMAHFAAFLQGRSRQRLFALSSGLAYLMHYATISLLYVQVVSLLPSRRGQLRRWFGVQALAFLPLVPWLALYVAHGIRPAGLSWIPRPAALAPLRTLWNFTTGDPTALTPLLALAAAAVGLVFVRGLLQPDTERGLLLWWLFLPMGFLFLLSLRRSYYVDRYLMASLPAYLLLLARGVTSWRRLTWRHLSLGLLSVTMLWGTARIYHHPHFAKEAWREATAAVETELRAGDIVVLQDQETLIGTSVYRTREWPSTVLEPGQEPATLAEAASRYSRIWLLWRSPRESNHRLSKSEAFDVFTEAAPQVQAWLATHRQQVALDLRLPGMSVVRIDVK